MDDEDELLFVAARSGDSDKLRILIESEWTCPISTGKSSLRSWTRPSTAMPLWSRPFSHLARPGNTLSGDLAVEAGYLGASDILFNAVRIS